MAGLVVICGRNAALRERIRATSWNVPVWAEGFVTNMPDWMGADLLCHFGPFDQPGLGLVALAEAACRDERIFVEAVNG